MSTIEVTDILVEGDRLWNGVTVCRSLADAYNSAQARIATFEAEGRPVPDHVLNGAHKLIAEAV